MFVVLFTIALALDMSAMKKEGVTIWRIFRLRVQPVALVIMLIIGILTTSYFSYQPIVEAITYKELEQYVAQIATAHDSPNNQQPDNIGLRDD